MTDIGCDPDRHAQDVLLPPFTGWQDDTDISPQGRGAKRVRGENPFGTGRVEPGDAWFGLGADVAIETVGIPATFELATTLIPPVWTCCQHRRARQAGNTATGDAWSPSVTITTGLVDTFSTPTLLRLSAGGQLDAAQFVAHHFAVDDMVAAYDTFARAATGALKMAYRRPSVGDPLGSSAYPKLLQPSWPVT